MRSKKELEMMLSRVKGFTNAKVRAEQYITPSDIASEVLWKAYFNGNIEEKVILDMGSGTGILGIGCLLLGANRVIFLEKDKEAMDICEQNIRDILELIGKQSECLKSKFELRTGDVGEFDGKVDTIITNPPFGTRSKHADKEFLIKAFETGDNIYSFHKKSTSEYIIELGKKNNFDMIEKFEFKFMLRNTMAHHVKKKQYIDVSCFHFQNKNN